MRVPQTKGGRPGTNTHMYMGFVNWFRQPGLLCAFLRRLVTVHVSPVSPSLNKEGNAACARQVCRKVTTRETRDQRRISTWYQNLRVLSAHLRGSNKRSQPTGIDHGSGWTRGNGTKRRRSRAEVAWRDDVLHGHGSIARSNVLRYVIWRLPLRCLVFRAPARKGEHSSHKFR